MKSALISRIEKKEIEYAVIGAGPFGLCAVVNILNQGVDGKNIVWIDPKFKVGDFGTIFSEGSSLPGNTAVEVYAKIRKEIYQMLPQCAPANEEKFEVDALNPKNTCVLKIAAQPFQAISDKLRLFINSLPGFVTDINTSQDGFLLTYQTNDGFEKIIQTTKIILAIGGSPKTLVLPQNCLAIDPIIPMIQSKLSEYLKQNSKINTIAVVGSSHSAALAVMHLLQAGIRVKHYMTKEYRYATALLIDGHKIVQYDNTGLKGEVAQFTKKLIEELNLKTSPYQNQYQRYICENKELIDQHLQEFASTYSHIAVEIGFKNRNSLRVDNFNLDELQHDSETTAFKNVPGLFGGGIAFPQRVQGFFGEQEYGVGFGKFWETAKAVSYLWCQTSRLLYN